MLYFTNDYSEGCHPEVLDAITKTNLDPQTGYGFDAYTLSAFEKIKKAINKEDAEVYFLTGGTQTNMMVIDTVLKPYEGVISAVTGHVAGHEAGAIEASGHKVLTIKQKDGKIAASDVKDWIDTFYNDANHSHMVHPGMVYISHPTEYGTLYSKKELEELHEVCKEYNIPLYLDGARLAYALAAKTNDVSLEDLARLVDIFYIGGTKCGALCGEALVFTHNNMPSHFLTLVKQHGALLAKGRLNGVQFDALFTNDLYQRLGKNAIDTADVIRNALKEKGYQIFIENPTNQVFVVMDNEQLKTIGEKVVYSFWEKYDDTHTVIRFATSWATRMEDVNKLLELL